MESDLAQNRPGVLAQERPSFSARDLGGGEAHRRTQLTHHARCWMRGVPEAIARERVRLIAPLAEALQRSTRPALSFQQPAPAADRVRSRDAVDLRDQLRTALRCAPPGT